MDEALAGLSTTRMDPGALGPSADATLIRTAGEVAQFVSIQLATGRTRRVPHPHGSSDTPCSWAWRRSPSVPRRELLATGETVRKRTVETVDELTPQEVQVARLAAGGQTNPEIGAQLFLSPRTVEWHLSKVFGKLGISSRKELSSVLSDAGD